MLAAPLARGQVKLNAAASPGTGNAGTTPENLTGSGFPAGSISQSTVTVSLAPTCDGTAVASVTASNIATVLGTTRRVSFVIPSSLPGGKYAVSVKAMSGVAFSTTTCSSLTVVAADPFLKAANGKLTLNGVSFRFGGGNSYVLMYSPPATVDQILETAVANNFKVIRTWGWLDIGQLNGAGSINGPQNGVYFQYWNGTEPAYNDGANGLQMLDYEIYKAGQLGLKLIIPFTNNWANFGGMDQYVEWAGDQYHDQFYTDPRIATWYKNWVGHLLNRVNTYSGIAYKNDPTIIVWELANEPRCVGSGTGSGGYPTSPACNVATLTSWISEVATYIKSVDPNHLVAVGDEGFFCTNPASPDFTENCSQGVDSIKFSESTGIDLMGFHLYPEGWGESDAWADTYITQHLTAGQSLGKPVYLGEYGLMSGNTRNTWYNHWTTTILTQGGEGALFWDVIGGQPGAAAAEDNGSFDLSEGAPLLTTINNFSQGILANTQLPFAPEADNQWATAAFNTAVTLNPIQNDVAYAGAAINSNSIDLDPTTPGQQTSHSIYGGELAVSSGGTVVFTPTPGFNGSTQGSYTVEDSNGKLSNVAYLNVTIQPSAEGTLNIESFETGTDGWGPLSSGGGTVAQSTLFPTDGLHSLMVAVASAGWFGVTFPAGLNLTGRPSLSIDVYATGIGGGAGIAFQSGPNYQWCQSQNFQKLLTNSENTLTIPLNATGATLNCSGGKPDLSEVETVYIYLPAPGIFYLDYLRAAPEVAAGGTIELFSFETGTQGWGAVNAGDATVQQTTNFHTNGNYGLQINGISGGWVGATLSPPADLTGKTMLLVDFATTSVATSTDIAIQSGPSYTWCQGTNFPFINAGTTTTISIQLDASQLTCFGGTLTLSQIQTVNVYFGGAGTYYIDNVRAQ